jgi:hypothetical protein
MKEREITMSYPVANKFDTTKCVALKPGKKVGEWNVVMYVKCTLKDGTTAWKFPVELEGKNSRQTAESLARTHAHTRNCAFIPNARHNIRCSEVSAE